MPRLVDAARPSDVERLRRLREDWDKVGVHPDQPPAAPPASGVPPSSDEGAEVDADVEQIEQDIRRVLHYAMRYGGGPTYRWKLDAAVAAIKYLAVKARLPEDTGEAFDETE